MSQFFSQNMKLLFNSWKKPLKCWLGIQTPTQISNMLQENSAEELSILNCEWSWNWRGILRLLCTIHSGSYNMEINLSKFLSHLASSGPFWPFYINFGQIYSETGFRTFINFHYLVGLWFPLQRVKKNYAPTPLLPTLGLFAVDFWTNLRLE